MENPKQDSIRNIEEKENHTFRVIIKEDTIN